MVRRVNLLPSSRTFCAALRAVFANAFVARLTNFRRNRSHVCFGGLAVLALLLWPCIAGAQTAQHVDTLADTTDSPNDCSTGAGSSCSLRDAINAASSGDTILFNSSLDGGTITLGSALPAISINLTISGPGANLLTVSGAGSFGIFDVTAGTVSITGLTIANGNGGSGMGGGLYIGGGSVTVENSTFSGNTAFGGAAIYSVATLVVSNDSFLNNTQSGGVYYGGAIASQGTAATIVNSTFASNSANHGGAVAILTGSAVITNNTFSGNSAIYGGAVDVTSNGTATIDNNIFSGNTATSGGAGAGIYNGGTESAGYNVYYKNLTNSSEDDCNSCTSNSTFTSATANPLALPLGIYGGTMQTLLPQPNSQAICAASSNLASNASLTTDQRGFAMAPTYSQCASGLVDAGAVQTNYIEVQASGDAGAGAGDCPGASCTLRDAIALASTGGGDIDFASSVTNINLTAANGTLPVSSATGIEIAGPGANQLTINGNGSGGSPLSVFTISSGDQALLYGLTVTGGYASANGGGVLNEGTLTILDSAISTNNAVGDGGGIENYQGTLTVQDSTINGNTSGGDGGGISNEGTGATASIVESTVYNNTDSGAGGGIYEGSGVSTTISGSSIWDNADNGTGGGAIYGSGSLTVNNIIAANNTSATSGAANIDATYSGTGNIVGGLNNSDTARVGGTGATVTLSSLQYNGAGTTVKTLIPLPGSPAICAGLAGNIPSGTTTDERGEPIENTTYPGYSSGTPCVDAGAVQTNYSMSFTSNPPSSVTVDEGFGAAVTLDESGSPFSASSVSIPLAVSSGTLSGTTTEATSAGVATYSGLSATLGSDLTLSATISLNSSLSLSTTGSDFTVSAAPTTVSLSPASQSSTVDGSLTFTATVSPNVTNEIAFGSLIPISGSVEFYVGSSPISNCTSQSVTFSSASGTATATCTTAALPAGNPDSITAVYTPGDSNYETSTTSSAVTATVSKSSTSVSVTSSPSGTSTVNGSVIFSATVQAPTNSSVTLTGSVTFTDNGSTITTCGTSGAVTVSGWNSTTGQATASCTTSALKGGTHSIIATYGGDGDYSGSNNNVTQTVNAASTTVAAPSESPSSPTVGQTVTITATVSSSGTLTVPFSGTMEFFNNGVSISSCAAVPVNTTSGTAQCQISGLTANTYSITAQYNTGDTSYSQSAVSSALSLTVGQSNISVGLTSSSTTPTVNQAVTFTATMSETVPLTGTITFTADGSAISSCPTITMPSSGVATCTDSGLTDGSHSIKAAYGGDSNFNASSNTITQAVSQAATTVAVTSSINPAVVDNSITFTATITPNPSGTIGLTGTVSFTDTPSGGSAAPISAACTGAHITTSGGKTTATCTTSALTVGSHTITATYGSDTNFSGNSGTFAQTVIAATSSITLASSSPSSSVNQPVTFVATIPVPSGQTPTGTLSFTDSASTITNCASVPPSLTVVGGTTWSASCTDLALVAGTHTIVAQYGGDSNLSVGIGSVTQKVSPVASSTVLGSNLSPAFLTVNNPSNYKDSLSFTATVSAPAGAVIPLSAGTVAFSVNGTVLAGCSAVTPVAGVATCTTTTAGFTDGANGIVATYSGDPNYTASSGLFSETIEDYSISVGPVPTAPTGATPLGVLVTQGYTTATDPFAPTTLNVTPTSVSGYIGTPTLTCASSSTTGAPKCTLAQTALTVINGTVQQSVGIVLDATSATPGTYSYTVTATDSVTGLARTATFPVTVIAVSSSLTVVSGSVSGNTISLSFILPPGVSLPLSASSCTSVVGPEFTGTLSPQKLNIGCSFNPSTIPSSGTTQNATVTATISTGSATAMVQPANRSGLLFAGVFGLPVFGLLGLLGGRKSARTIFLRLLAIFALCAAGWQVMGCGGSFQGSSTATGGQTPPGVYDILVQGTGSDGNTYETVIKLNVTL